MSTNNNNLINPTSLVSFILGIAAGLFICFIISSDPEADPEIDISANLITNAMAISMINNYSPCLENDNTVSGHVELDVLLGFINKMSNQCQSINMELSGLEYYFAQYSNDKDNADRRTVLFYPTYKDTIDGTRIIHVPFDPFSSRVGQPMNVIDMNDPGERTIETDTSRCVLDKSNMSPPRQATF